MPLDPDIEKAFERIGINIHQVLGEYMDEFTSGKYIRFRHVVGTLLQPIINWEYAGGSDLEIARRKGLLESYVGLIREFPRFREEELRIVDDPAIPGSIEEYVNRMLTELRGKSPKQQFNISMVKVSVVGIDNTGKTSIVNSLDEVDGLDTIRLTTYENNGSRVARVSGRALNRFAQFGEAHNLQYLTGFAYFLHLFPYYFEERAKRSSPVLVSDRDPIVDTLCYSDFYLPDGFSRIVRPPLKFMLEHSFNYPNLFFYLEASPEVSAQRNNKPIQLHDKIAALRRLKELFDEEMFRVESEWIPVVRIDTDKKSLEEVTNEAVHHVKRLL